MSKDILLDNAFTLDTKDFKEMALRAVNQQLSRQRLELKGKLDFTIYSPYSNDMTYVGYSQVIIQIKYTCKYSAEANVEVSQKNDSWPQRMPIGGFIYDQSNCGMGSIHNISNAGYKGFGVYTLSLLEQIMLRVKRKKIVCSINTSQKGRGADKWLEKFGYNEIDTFVGGNSGQKCYIYSKDLSEQNIIKVRPVENVKS